MVASLTPPGSGRILRAMTAREILEVVGPEFRVDDFIVDFGETLHDYLAKRRP